MTSLDFQNLLKQEKARHRAKLCAESAAQLREQSGLGTNISTSTHDHNTVVRSVVVARHDNCKRTPACGTREVGDGLKKEAEAAVAVTENAGDVQPAEMPSSCFAQLAARPSLDMTKIKVGDTPTIFYAPDFVTDTEEQQILDSTYAPPPGANSSDEWVTLTSRRLKCFGGQPGEGEGFVPETLPAWVEALCDALVERGIFSSEDRPNHVLLNEYQPGQGIMPHTDGPFYAPRTATLSLGSDAVMHFSPRVAAADIGQPGVDSRPQSSLVLRKRCLVVFADDAYSHLLHGIDAVREETVGSRGAPVINADTADAPEGSIVQRKLRVSLTFRRVRAGGSR